MRYLYSLFIVVFVLFFTGCSLFSSPEKKHYYQLYYNVGHQSVDTVDAVVRVKTFDIDKVYKKYNIVYRKSQYELFYYNTHFWATRPEAMVTDVIANHVVNKGLFKEVITRLDKKPDYVITGRILSIDEIDSGDRWFARVGLSITFTDFNTNQVYVEKIFEKRKEVFNKKPSYVVRAMSELLEEGMDEFLTEVEAFVSKK